MHPHGQSCMPVESASLASMPVVYASLALARCEHASRERASRGRMTDRSVNNSGHVGAAPTRAVAREHASRRATLCRAPRTGHIATLQCVARFAPTLRGSASRPYLSGRVRACPTWCAGFISEGSLINLLATRRVIVDRRVNNSVRHGVPARVVSA